MDAASFEMDDGTGATGCDADRDADLSDEVLFRDLFEGRSKGGIRFAGHGFGYNSRRIAEVQ
jgi:hypothetical protein